MNWNEIGRAVLICILKVTLKELEKSKNKKCRCHVDSKVYKTLKSFNENNELTLLEGTLYKEK